MSNVASGVPASSPSPGVASYPSLPQPALPLITTHTKTPHRKDRMLTHPYPKEAHVITSAQARIVSFRVDARGASRLDLYS